MCCSHFIFRGSLVVLIGIQMCSGLLFAQAPDAMEEITVTLQADKTPLSFVRLPRTDNIYGIVSGDTDPKQTYATSASYLARYELSLGVLKSLLSPASYKRYEENVLFFTSTDEDPKWGPYRQGVRNGSPDLPAIMVGVVELVEVCRELNDKAIPKGNQLDLRFEKMKFRIPSRLEWQFAARGVTTVKERNRVEYFPRWIDYSNDKNLGGNILDLQAALGDAPNVAAVVGQKAMLQLVERAATAKDKRGYYLLGKILQRSLGYEPNIGKSSESQIRPIVDKSPSPWGFHRMQGNVAEWVLIGTSLELVENQWKQLMEAEDLSTLGDQDFGIVMGGDFVVALPPFVTKGWLKHSITGGNPVDPTSLEPIPYKVKDCLAKGGVGIEDTNGGARLMLTRAMADNWFVALRSDTFLERSDDPLDQVTGYISNLVNEICSIKESNTNLSMIDFYRELTLCRDDISLDKWQEMLGMLEPVEKKYEASENVTSEAVDDAFAGFGLDEGEGGVKAAAGSDVNFFTVSRELATMEFQARK